MQPPFFVRERLVSAFNDSTSNSRRRQDDRTDVLRQGDSRVERENEHKHGDEAKLA
jgi:hypothetical protein